MGGFNLYLLRKLQDRTVKRFITAVAELINPKGICRTAPATLGLSNFFKDQIRIHFEYVIV